mmetsp:Transcript_26875/g.65841  ORF Transcript_26875/g.65841 Transcript_26875/m.65841 type:complete len:383 (+) Transcript_26875:774-1922(+)
MLEHLDPASKNTLAATLAFLQRVATAAASSGDGSGGGNSNSSVNGGGNGNGAGGVDPAGAHGNAVRTLASLFSPLLLRLRGVGKAGGGGGQLVEDVVRADHVVELLIEHHASILGGNNGAAGSRAGATGARLVSGGGGGTGGLLQSSNRMNVAAGANVTAGVGGEVTGATQAMRVLELVDGKENAAFSAGANGANKASTTTSTKIIPSSDLVTQQQPQQQPQQAVATSIDIGTSMDIGIDLPDPAAAADMWLGDCVGALMAGDDLFSAEIDRVAGTGLEVLYKTPVHRLAPEELASEKQAIKRRLRSFDNHVAACSGRKASKEDKRHLRPLYLRLAHVKRQIHVLETSGAGMMGYNSRNAAASTAAAAANERHYGNRGTGVR